MDAAVLVLAIVIFACFIGGIMSSHKDDPRDHATGRWGIKIGKVARGEFGGEKWGEKPTRKNEPR